MSLATAGHMRRAIASRGPAQHPFVAWSGAYQGGCDEQSSGLSAGEMATAQFRDFIGVGANLWLPCLSADEGGSDLEQTVVVLSVCVTPNRGGQSASSRIISKIRECGGKPRCCHQH